MTAKKKTAPPAAPVRFRRKEQLGIDVIDGATVLAITTGDYPAGVEQTADGLVFQSEVITESSHLVYDENGTPLALYDDEHFKETFERDPGAKGDAELRADLAEATTMIKKLQDQVLEQDALIDSLRKELAGGGKHDAALAALRDIIRIEPAQIRDDGGRIIHLNKKVLDRALVLL